MVQEIRTDERIAKSVLENIPPKNRFYGLEFSDKPDLQNNNLSIGVEVVSAIPEEIRQIDGICKKKLKIKDGKEIYGFVYGCGGFYKDRERIFKAFDKKIDKLNKRDEEENGKLIPHYKEFKHQCLFIIDINYIEPEDLKKIQGTFIRKQKRYDKKFSSVFLYLRDKELIEFCMISNTCKLWHCGINEDYINEINNVDFTTEKIPIRTKFVKKQTLEDDRILETELTLCFRND